MATDSVISEIFDSLPYYDDDLAKYPYLREKVEQEFAREPKAPQTLHPRVPPPVELFAVREHVHPISFRSGFNLLLLYFPE